VLFCKMCSVLLCVLEQLRVDNSIAEPINRWAQLGAISPICLRSVLAVNIGFGRLTTVRSNQRLCNCYCCFPYQEVWTTSTRMWYSSVRMEWYVYLWMFFSQWANTIKIKSIALDLYKADTIIICANWSQNICVNWSQNICINWSQNMCANWSQNMCQLITKHMCQLITKHVSIDHNTNVSIINHSTCVPVIDNNTYVSIISQKQICVNYQSQQICANYWPQHKCANWSQHICANYWSQHVCANNWSQHICANYRPQHMCQ
jgi:hypothetical protein